MGSGSYDKVLKKLEELESTSLSESIELYVRLTRLQLEARSQIKIKETRLSQKEIGERVGLGVIALKFGELQLDWARVDKLFKRALSIIGEYSSSIDSESDIPLRPIVESWYNKQSFPHDGMDEDLVTVAVHSAVKPFLARWAEVLLPEIDQEKWRRGYCPICGGAPNFSYLEPENGARWLCCPRCDAEWLFQRIECPFCRNIKQKELTYFQDKAGLYRVYTCEGCKGYLKAVDLRKGGKDIAIPLEWIKTLDMDRQACERGYQAGTMGSKIDDLGAIQAP
jgi:formate dehydrogenase maturation protein FdhE